MMMASHMDGGDGDDCIVQIVRCDAQERVNSCFNQGGGNWHNWRLSSPSSGCKEAKQVDDQLN